MNWHLFHRSSCGGPSFLYNINPDSINPFGAATLS
jgi:hypothetical protein